jgi:hypothetical protein
LTTSFVPKPAKNEIFLVDLSISDELTVGIH